MAGELKVNSVTALTESGSNIVLNNVDTATNRTNLGLGSIATQDATAVALTGGSITGTEFDLKSTGTSVYKSDGSTAVISESTGTVTVNNATLGSSVVFPAGSVIQIQQYEVQETNGLTTSYVNYWENSITLKSNSSDVILLVNFSYLVNGGGFGVQIYRNNSATVTTSHTVVWNKNLEAAGAPFTFYGAVRGTGSFYAKDSLSGFSVGDTLYYGLFARKYDSATVDLPAASTTNGYMSMVLMETQK